ncbi:hypothetical protein ACFSTC_13495 [Nonomuraea ferruginea]
MPPAGDAPHVGHRGRVRDGGDRAEHRDAEPGAELVGGALDGGGAARVGGGRGGHDRV